MDGDKVTLSQPAELLLFARRRTKLSESSANDLRGCGDILDEMEFSSSRQDWIPNPSADQNSRKMNEIKRRNLS